MRPKRKKPTFKERIAACRACDYPISQQHHIFPVAKYGADSSTIPLCANCHEISHMLYNAHHHKSQYSIHLLVHLLVQEDDSITDSIVYLAGIVLAADGKLDEGYKDLDIEARVQVLLQAMPNLFSAYHRVLKHIQQSKTGDES